MNNTEWTGIGVNDNLYPAVVKMAQDRGYVTTTYIQRVFKLGWHRAQHMFEAMQEQGLIADKPDSRGTYRLVKK